MERRRDISRFHLVLTPRRLVGSFFFFLRICSHVCVLGTANVELLSV